jgi:hypothetical protein
MKLDYQLAHAHHGELMSRRSLALFALLSSFILPAATASAQSIASLGIAAGATLPMGDFKERTEVGYHAMLTLDVHPPLSPLGLRIDGMFNELDLKNEFSSTSGKSRVWVGTANVVVNATGGLGPYFIGGLGLYHSSLTGGVALATSRSENKFGLNGGVGVRIPLTGFHAFVEARYHKVLDSTDDVALFPLTFGLVF